MAWLVLIKLLRVKSEKILSVFKQKAEKILTNFKKIDFFNIGLTCSSVYVYLNTLQICRNHRLGHNLNTRVPCYGAKEQIEVYRARCLFTKCLRNDFCDITFFDNWYSQSNLKRNQLQYFSQNKRKEIFQSSNIFFWRIFKRTHLRKFCRYASIPQNSPLMWWILPSTVSKFISYFLKNSRKNTFRKFL